MPDTSFYLFIGLGAFWVMLFAFIFLLQRKVSKLEIGVAEIENRSL